MDAFTPFIFNSLKMEYGIPKARNPIYAWSRGLEVIHHFYFTLD